MYDITFSGPGFDEDNHAANPEPADVDVAKYESHIAARTDLPPSILYKYMSIDVARATLASGKLRLQTPLRYNDPFDSQWDPLWQLRTGEALRVLRAEFRFALEHPESWPANTDDLHRRGLLAELDKVSKCPANEREQTLARLTDEIQLQQPNLAQRRGFEDRRRRMRVTCFSESKFDLLMWSHYADQHRGVLLGFSTRRLEEGWQRPIERVTYPESFPVMIDLVEWSRSFIYGLPAPGLLHDPRALALTKASCWQYEHEWRLVTRVPPGSFGEFLDLPLPTGALIEVAAGCRTDLMRAREMAALAYPLQPGLKLSRMHASNERFGLAEEVLSDA